MVPSNLSYWLLIISIGCLSGCLKPVVLPPSPRVCVQGTDHLPRTMVQALPSQACQPGKSYRMVLHDYQHSDGIITSSATNNLRQQDMHLSILLDVYDDNDKLLEASHPVTVTQPFVRNNSQILSNDLEIETITHDLQADLAQALITQFNFLIFNDTRISSHP